MVKEEEEGHREDMKGAKIGWEDLEGDTSAKKEGRDSSCKKWVVTVEEEGLNFNT